MATTKIIPGVLDLNSATSDKGLKMPSGTIFNRPTGVTGSMRNNTSESSNGGASAMEYYNGTEWQKISNDAPPVFMDYLVVAGGGTGGSYYNGNAGQEAGGGGAGGVRTSYGSISGGGCSAETILQIFPGTYTITVGAGGAVTNTEARSGNPSSIADATTTLVSCTGGGRGGGNRSSTHQVDSQGGGSGGGGGCVNLTGKAGTACEGFAGSNKTGSSGGAGGGAGEAPTSYNGGDGIEVSITGTATYYGGGGGGSDNAGVDVGTGGQGGGGAGNGGSATANTGGGSGGGAPGGVAASGGSGVVILRLPTSKYSGNTTGSPTVTTDGTDTILKFTGSGTYVHS